MVEIIGRAVELLSWPGLDLMIDRISTNKWLLALTIFIGFFLISIIGLFLLDRYLRKFVQKLPHGEFLDTALDTTSRPLNAVVLILGLRLGLIALGLPETYGGVITRVLDTLITILFTFVVVLVFKGLIEHWGERWAKRTHTKLDDQLLPLARNTLSVLIFIIGFLLVLDVWGINIGPFLASLGIAGIAIGLAVKDPLANIFGGVQIVADQNFKVGDIVEIDGTSGSIHEIGIRTTKVKAFDGHIVFFPNAKLSDSVITNYSKRPRRQSRFSVPFEVPLDADPDKVEKIASKAADAVELILKDPAPIILFDEIGDYALRYKVLYWVKERADKLQADRSLKHNLLKGFSKAGIEMPNPTYTIYTAK